MNKGLKYSVAGAVALGVLTCVIYLVTKLAVKDAKDYSGDYSDKAPDEIDKEGHTDWQPAVK